MFDNYVYFTVCVQNYSVRNAQLNVLMLIRRRRSSPCGVTCNLLKENKYKILYRLIDDIYFNTGFKLVNKIDTVNTNINQQLFLSQKTNKPELYKKEIYTTRKMRKKYTKNTII